MNELERIDRKLLWLRLVGSVLLIANVASAIWNFHRGAVLLGGISTGAALLSLMSLAR